MSTPAIAARTLGRRYGRAWGLRDCTLDIGAGRVVGLVGPNGAGKSTLLNLLTGLLRPTTGELELFGRPVRPGEPADGVAYLDQRHALYESFRVREMLEAARRLNRRWDHRVALDRVRELGIPLERRVGELSGGQRAQVALSVALARRPQLLVLDEPVASLDPLARRDLMGSLMAAKAEDDCTVVLSSHVVSELERLCDYLVVLDHGRVVLSGDVDELMAAHVLLTGPSSTVDEVRGVPVSADRRGTVTALLFRGTPPPLPPGWRAGPVSLEDLVLHHLAAGRPTEVAA
ncbi:ABC transporter ATP-binding protein [Amycolatopsis rhabdoformis]|uniref:ABC transporter ATP-binding protein n=1 Tax=Amycolatopsis rhabdoformis TaxID=1448059 RepID=A0ABZ1IH69_9PSEU|nr:ABC transporter ATP-binding protein [Amycolatopsis rhabdoformis]WSE32785.1 ABC transporter ATP-binding protein [Amycolatopsis rhabdoformis]